MKDLCLVVGFFILLTSCNEDRPTKTAETARLNPIDNRLNLGASGSYYFDDPIKIADVNSFNVGSQIYESLLRFDETDLALKPMLANSWKISDDGLVYTFRLKRGVFFHDNDCFEGGKGREIKADDVLYTFKRVCSNYPDNYAYTFFHEKLVGAEQFHNSEKGIDEKELEGVKALDDYTVEFELKNTSSNFLDAIANIIAGVVAREAIEQKEVVGSGPFIYTKEEDTEKGITLRKNLNYHMSDSNGYQLPYLDAVRYENFGSIRDEIDAFLAGKIDVVSHVPVSEMKRLVENQILDFKSDSAKFFLERIQPLSTALLELNTTKEPFNNIKIRQAFAHAIDKSRIVESVLRGQAYGGAIHGIVSPAVVDYDYSSIVGKEFNIKKAKKLLEEEGYKGGKDFPKITLFTNESNNFVRVALDIQKQLLANLNIHIEVSTVPFNEFMEHTKNGTGNIFLTDWYAESPDALSFLSLGYGVNVPKLASEPSILNGSRYVNPEFDKLYRKASEATDLKQKNELCLAADQILANDAPIIPLWYDEDYNIIYTSVKNYKSNSLTLHYFTNVKIIP